MCIYLRNRDNLTYNGREHIFPAAIGGIHTLEKGCVSDQANSIFCKLEDEMIHASTVSLCRGFSGPGKRGSTLPSGTVRILYFSDNDGISNKLSLGFMSMGKVYHIPHINISANSFSFSDEYTSEKELTESFHKFLNMLSEFNKSPRFVNITPDNYSDDTILIGFYDKKWYVVCPDKESIHDKIDALLKSKDSVGVVSHSILQPSLNDRIQESEATDRAYAKIAFNVLCKLYGADFISSHSFDIFRNWIVSGEPNNNNWINEHLCQNSDFPIRFPEDAHWCLLTQIQNQICAIVCLYNILRRKYIIGEIPNGSRFRKIDGYICDWKKHIEYNFMDYINTINILDLS